MKFLLLVFTFSSLLSACGFRIDPRPIDLDSPALKAQAKQSLFVFYDGTSNSKKSNTNISKLFDIVVNDQNPNTHAIWVEGVGASSRYITGNLFGGGIETRLNTGYRFLSKHYQSNDDIYIFGFSRGAHQARALAGLISYSGLLQNSPVGTRQFNRMAHTIIEQTKDVTDEQFKHYWSAWTPDSKPPLAQQLKRDYGYNLMSAKIKFLGLWDNVPASSFKSFNEGEIGIEFTDSSYPSQGCKESKDGKKGDRYKLDSYPTIQNIAHAVAIDEMRSKFKVVLACQAMHPAKTHVNQVWFPGAHSDVGGGYSDNDLLSNLSLAWMIDQFKKDNSDSGYVGYQFNKPTKVFKLDPLAPSHLSLSDFPANIGSKCRSRPMPKKSKNYAIWHKSRQDNGAQMVRVSRYLGLKKRFVPMPYPLKCSGLK